MGKGNVLIDGIYTFSNVILRLLYINVLWIVFSLLGLVVLGFFPATVAMFTVMRKWQLDEFGFRVFETFWDTYKKQLLKANLLGYSLSFIGVILAADLLYLQNATHSFLQVLYFPVLAFSFLYVLSLLFVFPIYVHYEVKGFNILKNAFFISIITPFATFKMVIGLLLILYLFTVFPGAIILFIGSIPSYFMMRIGNSAFTTFERKRATMVKGT